MKPIKRARKRHARSIRKGVGNPLPSGKVETHKMSTVSFDGKHYAYPTITFDKEGKVKGQSFDQAMAAGEVYEFDKFNRASKFAHGSWKQGKDRREAIKKYRRNKRT